jgi:bifunctional DNA-binding transcriptional regulator/antitoxin component of YhaV-PrlF toxin-antitoxin module
MTTLTITAKGQVTLKRELLQHLGVGPGEQIAIDMLPNSRIVVRASTQDKDIGDFIRCLAQKGGTKLTIAQMNEIASRGWAAAK